MDKAIQGAALSADASQFARYVGLLVRRALANLSTSESDYLDLSSSMVELHDDAHTTSGIRSTLAELCYRRLQGGQDNSAFALAALAGLARLERVWESPKKLINNGEIARATLIANSKEYAALPKLVDECTIADGPRKFAKQAIDPLSADADLVQMADRLLIPEDIRNAASGNRGSKSSIRVDSRLVTVVALAIVVILLAVSFGSVFYFIGKGVPPLAAVSIAVVFGLVLVIVISLILGAAGFLPKKGMFAVVEAAIGRIPSISWNYGGKGETDAGGMNDDAAQAASRHCAEQAGAGAENPSTVDVLRLVDPHRDAVEGEWRMDGASLVADVGKTLVRCQRLQLPVQPSEEYDLKLVIERLQGGYCITLGIKLGGKQVRAAVGGWADAPCLELVEGRQQPIPLRIAKDSEIKVGEKATIQAFVRKGNLRIAVNSAEIIDWSGDPSSLSVPPQWRVRSEDALFIGGGEARIVFSEIKLTPIGASGTP